MTYKDGEDIPEELVVADIPGHEAFVVTVNVSEDELLNRHFSSIVVTALRLKALVLLEEMIREELTRFLEMIMDGEDFGLEEDDDKEVWH